VGFGRVDPAECEYGHERVVIDESRQQESSDLPILPDVLERAPQLRNGVAQNMPRVLIRGLLLVHE
jgi:hypothetical protein